MLMLNAVETLAAGAVTLLLGRVLVRAIPAFGRYNLPAPVLGGLLVSLILTALRVHSGDAPVTFDTSLQVPLMIVFFAAIGFGASWVDLKRGGPRVALYLGACTILLLAQNGIGIVFAKIFGLHPLFGVMVGSVTLAGGPATALAFSGAFEKAGLAGAAPLGLTAAMAGILLAGLLGGPVATFLIERKRLRPSVSALAQGGLTDSELPANPVTGPSLSLGKGLFRHLTLLLMILWIGGAFSSMLKSAGIALPAYVGAMLLAAVVRNVDDRRLNFFDRAWVAALGGVALEFFLAVSMMTLELWRLKDLALPLGILLVIQAVFMVVVSMTLMFRFSGRDYDAAVMTGGLLGFMLGTTANTMANMDSLTRRYGPAPRAYLIVPIVGACFIDFTNAAAIAFLLNIFASWKFT